MNSNARLALVRRLGGGGMGDVFLARRIEGQTMTWVAVKRMRPSVADDLTMRARFEREARVSALLRHPNIVSTIEHGADDQGPFLVLDYIEGHSAARLLAAAVARREHLPLHVALSILVDAAVGLTCAHEYTHETLQIDGIVHRDLTPDNILVGFDGVARVLDFGIAWLAGNTELTATGKLMGKAGFIAPEAYEGQQIDKRSDLFSFGATAFRLLTAVPPFHANSEAGMMRAVIAATPPLVTTLRPDVPSSVAQLIAQCLEKTPNQRPVSIRAVAEQLQEVLATLSVEPQRETSALMLEWMPAPIALQSEAPSLQALPEALEERRTAAADLARPPRRTLWARVALFGSLMVLVALSFVFWPRRSVPLVESREGMAAPSIPQTASPAEELPVAEPEAVAPTPSTPEPAPPLSVRSPILKAPSAPAKGTLRIRVKPYGDVFLDGRLLGQTPVPEQRVEPGLHAIIVVNNALGVRRRFQVRVRAGEAKNFFVDVSQ